MKMTSTRAGRDFEKFISRLLFKINDEYMLVFSIFQRDLSDGAIKTDKIRVQFFRHFFCKSNAHENWRKLSKFETWILLLHSIDLVEI